jgi:hypothetical protein
VRCLTTADYFTVSSVQQRNPNDADALLLRAQVLADQVLDAKHPVAGRIQFMRAAVCFVRGDLLGAKLALERASAAQATGTNDLCQAMSLRGQALLSLVQGVVGRAFLIAGAQTVLASHWNINDNATSQLMTEFMRRWRAGEPRAQTWHEAQLEMLRSKDFPNPYFWSAFTLTGRWN